MNILSVILLTRITCNIQIPDKVRRDKLDLISLHEVITRKLKNYTVVSNLKNFKMLVGHKYFLKKIAWI